MRRPTTTSSLNEAQARYVLIDPALRDARWKLDDRLVLASRTCSGPWAMGDALRNNMDASDSKRVKFGVSLT